jgi:hypothetical protein
MRRMHTDLSNTPVATPTVDAVRLGSPSPAPFWGRDACYMDRWDGMSNPRIPIIARSNPNSTRGACEVTSLSLGRVQLAWFPPPQLRLSEAFGDALGPMLAGLSRVPSQLGNNLSYQTLCAVSKPLRKQIEH